MNDSVMDFLFYTAHDGIKKRALPNQDELIENGIVSFGYNMIAKQPFEQVSRFVPEISAQYTEDITKFVAESAIFWGIRYIQGKPRMLGPILLKQLLAQGSQVVYKQLS